MFYSATTGGFYSREIHGDNMPTDAVEITADVYSSLLSGQSDGKIIAADDHGYPMLIDRPAPTLDEAMASERFWRDRQVAATDYLAMPDYPLTDAQRTELYTYRQALRDWPSADTFPTADNRPQPPTWLAEILVPAA